MKKLLSIGLAAMLAFGLATTSFAEEAGSTETPSTTSVTSFNIDKTYNLVGDAQTASSPQETFYLDEDATQRSESESGVPAEKVPALPTENGHVASVAFAKGDAGTDANKTKQFTVNLPNVSDYPKVGAYHYVLKEVAGTNAGVAYTNEQINVTVYVVNAENSNDLVVSKVVVKVGDKKSGSITNTYSAGSLKVTKTVKGNLGDKDKYFEFTVKLTGETGKTYADSFAVSGGSNKANPTSIKLGEKTTFLLKHGETITIANLPYDVEYTVTETSAAGYTTTFTGDQGFINAAEQTAAFTNTKDGNVDTGVVLNNMPYILVLAVLAAGVAVFIIRKRRED